MNIIFKLDNGKLIQIFWDNNFDCYGVGLELLPVFEERESVKLVNVSENESVLTFKGNKIVDVLIHLDGIEVESNWFFFTKQKKCNGVPLVWQIKFENNTDIWIATLEIFDIEAPYYWADHLTVFFNEEDVRKYKLNSDNEISINSVI